MKNTTAKALIDVWNAFEDAEPDISTERLLALTAEVGRQLFGPDIDEGHVVEALSRSTTWENTEAA